MCGSEVMWLLGLVAVVDVGMGVGGGEGILYK